MAEMIAFLHWICARLAQPTPVVPVPLLRDTLLIHAGLTWLRRYGVPMPALQSAIIGRKFADLCGDGRAIHGALGNVIYRVLQAARPCDLATLRRQFAAVVHANPAIPASFTQACRFMPARVCGRTLVVLDEWGSVVKGQVFDEIAQLHELVEMVGLHKIGVGSHRERLLLIGGISGAGHDYHADIRPLRDRLDPLQQLSAIALGEIEIKQHDGGRPTALLVGKLVHILHGMIAVIDHVKLMGQLMGIEHPPDEVDVHGIIFHDNDSQRGTRC
jgi:hypothetical protein